MEKQDLGYEVSVCSEINSGIHIPAQEINAKAPLYAIENYQDL